MKVSKKFSKDVAHVESNILDHIMASSDDPAFQIGTVAAALVRVTAAWVTELVVKTNDLAFVPNSIAAFQQLVADMIANRIKEEGDGAVPKML